MVSSRVCGALNPLKSELNPICHLLALLGARHIFHVSGIWVKNLQKVYTLQAVQTFEQSSNPLWHRCGCWQFIEFIPKTTSFSLLHEISAPVTFWRLAMQVFVWQILTTKAVSLQIDISFCKTAQCLWVMTPNLTTETKFTSCAKGRVEGLARRGYLSGT